MDQTTPPPTPDTDPGPNVVSETTLPLGTPGSPGVIRGKGRRPTDRERDARIREVLNLRLSGAEVWDILQYFAEERPADRGPRVRLSERAVYGYIQKANALLAKHLDYRRGQLIDRHIAQRRRLYASALAKGDERAALAVLADEAKMLNLYPRPTNALTDAELDAELAALATAREGEGPGTAAGEGPPAEDQHGPQGR